MGTKEEVTYAIVGSTEADPFAGKISNRSLVGMALIGKAIGEEVEISVPDGIVKYKILTQLGLVGATVMTEEKRHSREILQSASVAALFAITLPNSRAAEIEADRMGIELAARAGYNPFAAVSLWEKMARVSGSGPPQFLSTHPSPYNRQRILAGLATKMAQHYHPEHYHPVHPLKSG